MLSPHQAAARARELRYRRLAADPAIATRTDFFRAAAVVTKALATRDQPSFLTSLAAKLEVANVRRAREIRSGKLYARGSAPANTADFVRFEQSLVEAELRELRERDPAAYDGVVARANLQIARATRGMARWMNREFARAVIATRRQLGRDIDFSRCADREMLGIAIARQSQRR
jgi:hypothetical protein